MRRAESSHMVPDRAAHGFGIGPPDIIQNQVKTVMVMEVTNFQSPRLRRLPQTVGPEGVGAGHEMEGVARSQKRGYPSRPSHHGASLCRHGKP